MDVKLRFPLGKPIILEDSWPLEGYDAIVEFDRQGQEAVAIVVTFRNQPIELAPAITATPGQEEQAHIEIRGHFETRAASIIRRLREYIGLYQWLDVRQDDVEISFIGTTDAERSQIKLTKFSVSKDQPRRRFLFSMLAQAFFAGESGDDLSFVSHMTGLAREALISEQYIDAFRYAFLLCEALYGDGKFKTAPLVQAMHDHDEFRSIVERIMAEFMNEPIHQRSSTKQLVSSYPTALSMIKHLVDRRGFYFHGNLAREDSWHPDRQAKAREVAEIAVGLAAGIAHSIAGAMFRPEITARFFENAKRQGAIVSINIDIRFRDENGFERVQSMSVSTPGTRVTNAMALHVQAQFLDWAQVELSDKTLISAVAIDKNSGKELFHSHYLDAAESKPEETSCS